MPIIDLYSDIQSDPLRLSDVCYHPRPRTFLNTHYSSSYQTTASSIKLIFTLLLPWPIPTLSLLGAPGCSMKSVSSHKTQTSCPRSDRRVPSNPLPSWNHRRTQLPTFTVSDYRLSVKFSCDVANAETSRQFQSHKNNRKPIDKTHF